MVYSKDFQWSVTAGRCNILLSPEQGQGCGNMGFPDSKINFISFFGSANLEQCPGRFLGIIGRDSSVSNSNRLRVDISI